MGFGLYVVVEVVSPVSNDCFDLVLLKMGWHHLHTI